MGKAEQDCVGIDFAYCTLSLPEEDGQYFLIKHARVEFLPESVRRPHKSLPSLCSADLQRSIS